MKVVITGELVGSRSHNVAVAMDALGRYLDSHANDLKQVRSPKQLCLVFRCLPEGVELRARPVRFSASESVLYVEVKVPIEEIPNSPSGTGVLISKIMAPVLEGLERYFKQRSANFPEWATILHCLSSAFQIDD